VYQMAKIRCPICGSEAAELGGMLMLQRSVYCVRCGWNIPEMSAKLRTSMFGLLGVGGFGLFLVFIALARGHQGGSGALAIGVAFVFLPSALAILARVRLARLARASDRETSDEGDVARSPMSAFGDPNVERVRFSSRPRTVRMSWKGHLFTIAVSVCTVFVIWLVFVMASTVLRPPAGSVFKGFLMVGVLGWWLWSCLAFFRERIRERNLFIDGDFATGVVLSRTEGRNGPYIVYSFRPPSGSSLQRRCRDYSNDQFEQMPLHVFYDPTDPSRNAALESSVFRIS
jgi:hypothetical protein